MEETSICNREKTKSKTSHRGTLETTPAENRTGKCGHDNHPTWVRYSQHILPKTRREDLHVRIERTKKAAAVHPIQATPPAMQKLGNYKFIHLNLDHKAVKPENWKENEYHFWDNYDSQKSDRRDERQKQPRRNMHTGDCKHLRDILQRAVFFQRKTTTITLTVQGTTKNMTRTQQPRAPSLNHTDEKPATHTTSLQMII